MSRLALASVVALLLVIAFAIFCYPPHSPSLPLDDFRGQVADHEDEPRLGVDAPEWVEGAAKQPTRVAFRRAETSGDSSLIGLVQTKGPLSAGDKSRERERIVRHIAAHYTKWEQMCSAPGSGAGGAKTMRDALDEMDMLLMAKRHEARLRLLDTDCYLTVGSESGDLERIVLPKGSMRTVAARAGKIDGVRVDVVYLIPGDAPEVASILRERNLLDVAASNEDVEAFNALSFEVRKVRFDRHQAAVARFLSISGTSPPIGDDVARDRRSRELQECVADMLPSSWVVDSQSFYARLGEKM